MRRVGLRIIIALLAVAVTAPQAALALSFDQNRIINDEDMTGGLFSLAQTVSFLRSKDGYLGQNAELYGQQIYDAAITNGLNPQFLLVTIQKESSLIEDPNPSQHRIDYALGFGCPDTSGCDPSYKGFSTQILQAAGIFRAYLEKLAQTGSTHSGWSIGQAKRTGVPGSRLGWEVISGQPVYVTPENAATAALYTYTPWVGGHTQPNGTYVGANYNFRVIWERYFIATRIYPDGSLLRGKGQAGIWLIKDGKRHPFLSQAAFLANYDSRKVITVPPEELEQYERGPGIRYANTSLLQAPSGGIYLLADGFKRPITSRRAFQQVGFNPEEVVKGVTWDELDAYPDGEPITEETVSPTGKLVQLDNSGIAYVDEHNSTHAIHSKEILRSQFGRQRAERISTATFEALASGEPVKFRDGELVRAPGLPSVYLISNGEKRPIASAEAFRAYRYSWRNVITTTARALEIHPTGEPLDVVAE
ncbi:MAG: hypothetical protein HYZ09_01870 [Candidatus Kerfeldbacteria bacterium]|nr:hypothetical protein [Candidatus Kerfeldbacteria bacterium]